MNQVPADWQLTIFSATIQNLVATATWRLDLRVTERNYWVCYLNKEFRAYLITVTFLLRGFLVLEVGCYCYCCCCCCCFSLSLFVVCNLTVSRLCHVCNCYLTHTTFLFVMCRCIYDLCPRQMSLASLSGSLVIAIASVVKIFGQL